jgi:hypothetical protein
MKKEFPTWFVERCLWLVTIAVYGIQESGMKSSAERVRQDELIFASTAESQNHRLRLVDPQMFSKTPENKFE